MFEGKELSRRSLISGAGKLAVGAIGAAAFTAGGMNVLRAETKDPRKLPWPYEKIDPQEAAKIAYDGWYKGFCSYGVASGILVPLQQKIGEPYAMLPVEGLRLGEGGTVGWGTLCGSLLGATVAVGFIAPYDDGKKIVNELLQWYSDSELPRYAPSQPKADVKVKTVSGSPLCHLSVGKWTKAANKSLGSPERKDRCARVTADVAMKTVMLLNDWKDGKFTSSLKIPSALYGITAQHNCTECHSTNVPQPPK
ncbi:MAG TPA: C-GCAxxG-C-C family (seleno)protein [Dissulfurispiraceae bacterium]